MLAGEAERVLRPCCRQSAKPGHCSTPQARSKRFHTRVLRCDCVLSSSSVSPACLYGQGAELESAACESSACADVAHHLCSAAGLFKSMALGALARRAEHLPGLLSELRPHLKRLLDGQSDTLQAATLALLEALLPKEPDAEAGGFQDVSVPDLLITVIRILYGARFVVKRIIGWQCDAGLQRASFVTEAHACACIQSCTVSQASRYFATEARMLKVDLLPGWVLSILLEASDFTRHPSKTVRLHLFSILRDAWQLRPSLQVCNCVHLVLLDHPSIIGSLLFYQ